MAEQRGPGLSLSRPLVGILTIVGLVIVLQIPIGLIRGLIQERETTRDAALSEVTATWGGAQTIAGPRIEVPYRRTGEDASTTLGYASFLPESLTVEGRLATQSLSRGLFNVPVYDATLRLSGDFAALDFDQLGIDEADVLWDRAVLVIEVSDTKALGGETRVTWGGAPVDLQPGAGASGRSGIHGGLARPEAGGPTRFVADLALRGSSSLWLVPHARETVVALGSDWAAPSFTGGWLPVERTVEADGFDATWRVPFLGRDYPQAWVDTVDPAEQVAGSRFGVELVSPVDHYRMSERSTKYAALFLLLTFGLLWLFDVLGGVRVHPVQLLLIGAAMCVFYLLELSLSEHVGFFAAYATAATAVVALVGGYTRSALRSTRRGAIAGGLLGGLYAYLLTLLSLEAYALLAGSLGLFALLAATMYLTRWIDWHALSLRSERAEA